MKKSWAAARFCISGPRSRNILEGLDDLRILDQVSGVPEKKADSASFRTLVEFDDRSSNRICLLRFENDTLMMDEVEVLESIPKGGKDWLFNAVTKAPDHGEFKDDIDK